MILRYKFKIFWFDFAACT